MKMRNITAGPFDAIDVEPWPELRQVSAFHTILIQTEFPETSPTPYSPPQNHPKAFKHYITLKLFFPSLRWWTLYGFYFRVSDHKICLPNHLRWARKLLPSASVKAKCGQPLTIIILPYYKMWCVTNVRLCAIELQLEASGAVYGCLPATLVKQHHWQIVKHGTERAAVEFRLLLKTVLLMIVDIRTKEQRFSKSLPSKIWRQQHIFTCKGHLHCVRKSIL